MRKLLKRPKSVVVMLFLTCWLMAGAILAVAGPWPHKPPCQVPEPSTIALLGAGLISVGLYSLKKLKKR